MKCEVKNGIYWVGAIDWNMRDFHGYDTPKGTSYNAYLVTDGKTALVDTVKGGFSEEMLMGISEHMDPARIDYVIVNHLEKDHSGSLEDVMAVAKNAQIYCSARAKAGLVDKYGEKWPINVVKTGDTLKLGKKTLRFIEVPMVHWPDSMFTYVEEDKVLLSNDAFGQHLATSQRFEDQVRANVLYDARAYYANILMPLSSIISETLKKLPALDLAPEIIAPSHGLIWRRDPGTIISAYVGWSSFRPKAEAVIAYGSMWGLTDMMARLIAFGAMDEGVDVRLYDIQVSSLAAIMTDLLEAKAVIVGSSTQNNVMLHSTAEFMAYLKSLRPKNKIAAAFGAYGWAGGAVKEIDDGLKAADLETMEPLAFKHIMTTLSEDDRKRCIEFGREIAKKIKGGLQ
ncbi:MAG TPA: FprA family A-type flavoprotein [Methanocella sp.]|nr:FprA family A-type flavoprotein [Methanocella sp.]